jgi:hypothetical protein
MFERLFLYVFGALLMVALSACSFSDSSNSISKSSGSFSRSSSSFSGGAAKYQADVTDYTYAYLKSSSAVDYPAFEKGLSKIAADNGVSDWQSDSDTYQAIGKALKKAQIAGVGYETYKKNFADSDSSRMQSIDDGYRSAE